MQSPRIQGQAENRTLPARSLLTESHGPLLLQSTSRQKDPRDAATIAGNIDAKTVRQLALNGRDWTLLATLNAGVDTVPVQQPNQGFAPKGNRGYGNQMTISGTRPQQNNYRLDGISINDYSNGAPGSVVGLNLGVDTIAEFSVMTSNYSHSQSGVPHRMTNRGEVFTARG